eukprot:3162660-Prymnesium_polylepis.2
MSTLRVGPSTPSTSRSLTTILRGTQLTPDHPHDHHPALREEPPRRGGPGCVWMCLPTDGVVNRACHQSASPSLSESRKPSGSSERDWDTLSSPCIVPALPIHC